MQFSQPVATIIVAILGAFASCFTFLIGKRHEKKVELRKIKENQYIDFLSALVKVKLLNSYNSDLALQYKIDLSIKIQTIFLVGSKDVQLKLKNYLNIFTTSSYSEKQSQLYGELIQAMKIDLYGRKYYISSKSFNSLNNIQFTLFNW